MQHGAEAGPQSVTAIITEARVSDARVAAEAGHTADDAEPLGRGPNGGHIHTFSGHIDLGLHTPEGIFRLREADSAGHGRDQCPAYAARYAIGKLGHPELGTVARGAHRRYAAPGQALGLRGRTAGVPNDGVR